MKIRRFTILRWVSIGLIILSAILFVTQLVSYSRLRSGFPPGTLIAGVSVGGLNQQQAADRLEKTFTYPIEVFYGEDYFQIKPSALGFSLSIEAMIAAADQQRTNAPFWSSFWDYLWNKIPQAYQTPLMAEVDERRIRMYLIDEVASRYDKVPKPSEPVPGSVTFQLGSPGEVLDLERSIEQITKALMSSTNRNANLVINNVSPPKPAMENLEILLKQIIDRSRFDGLTEVYVLDLESRKEISFAYENGQEYEPGIVFTAASTIKIPIMLSVFRQIGEPTPQAVANLMEQMIVQSENDPADRLMQIYLDPNIGPNFITNDLQAIGLDNTFLAGHFYPGAVLLNRYRTPANMRTDYTTEPDPYNQTTTIDMGMLLDDIYQCAQTGGGTIMAVFEGELSQTECQLMITYLSRNKIGGLLEAGLPDGTKIAHKHGWTSEYDTGIMRSLMDAGIVYSPKGNYVVCIAMYQPTQLIYPVANQLIAQLSSAIYNYFNISG